MTAATSVLSGEARAALRKAISDAYYDARAQGQTMEIAADNAVAAIEPIVISIDQNAHARGRTDA